MTDKEIIKALGVCISDLDCTKCPYTNVLKCSIERDCIDLINRQQAEIERLTVNMNAFGLGMKREAERANTARAEAIKEFAERLNAQFSNMENQPPSDRMIIRINEVKSLMDWILHDITKQAIAEVAKEMTEGNH